MATSATMFMHRQATKLPLLAIPLFVDNQSTRDIIGKSRVSDRSKYAEIQVHYVRERVARGEGSPMIHVGFLPTGCEPMF
jgi:hypothetical protein